MKSIPLTQGKFALVDDEDYDFLMQWKWFYIKATTGRENGYAGKKGENGSNVKMESLLLNLTANHLVDHCDGDGLNNQKANLRIATKQQNGFNRIKQSDTRSKFKGVTRHKKRNKWQAQIWIDGKFKYLGSFKLEEDAALAYNAAAKVKFGEFAKLNVITV